MIQRKFEILLTRVTPMSHTNTSSMAVSGWLSEMPRMRQSGVRKKEVEGVYWAIALDFLYWALRSGDAKYTERKISARTNGEILFRNGWQLRTRRY